MRLIGADLHRNAGGVFANKAGLLLGQILVPRIVEQRVACGAVHRLALEQHFGHQMHLVGVLGQDLIRRIVRLLHQTSHFLVDALRRLGRVVLRVAVIATQEHLVVGLAERLLAQRVGHSVARHHLARLLGGTLEIIACAGGDVAAENLLGDATAHEDGQIVHHLVAADQELVLVGDGHGVAQRHAARHDGDLVHRIGIGKQMPHQGMAALVVRDDLARLLVHHAVLALGARHQALHGFVDFGHADDLLVAARGEQSRLVHEVHEVGAGHAARELGDALQIHIGTQGLVLGVHLKDLLAATYIGCVHHDLAIETAGAQQGRVKHIHAVGGGNQHHGIVFLEAVHLNQQLVEGLLALVMAAAQACAALAAHCVDLVDEDDGGSSLFGLLEQAAHAACTHAHEHLHELRAGDAEERHLRLACHGTREQRLACARRAHQKAAARNLGA